ncbi:hypothetical protein CLAVI_000869 [Candidatus Clavichlamydia salmonicola]|uniref:hypothetical protein n=1 Tax=Candidatus Clavichlamydia salmonicola TaxID=469812 RepID=UPI001890BA42|nr:hypothetical protein [Candidatus Clavichlamydia salmonicola]MBF5051228.1 hypothetical protein [Candidatus Clavichlamydia salmonicola]
MNPSPFNFSTQGASPAILTSPPSTVQTVSNAYHNTVASQLDACQAHLNQLGTAVGSLNSSVPILQTTLQNQRGEFIVAQNDLANLKVGVSNLQLGQNQITDEISMLKIKDEEIVKRNEKELMTQVDIINQKVTLLQTTVRQLTDDVQANDPSNPGFREVAAKAKIASTNATTGKKNCCFNVCRGISISFFVIIALVALAALIIFILCILGHMPSAESAIMGWEGSTAFGANAMTTMAIGAGVISITSMLAAGLVAVGCKKRPTTIEATKAEIQISPSTKK